MRRGAGDKMCGVVHGVFYDFGSVVVCGALAYPILMSQRFLSVHNPVIL